MRPIGFHGALRHPEHLRHLGDAEAGEEPQLDDPRLARVVLAEALEGGVEGQQLVGVQVAAERVARRADRDPKNWVRLEDLEAELRLKGTDEG